MSGIQQSFGFWSSGSSGQPTWISSLGSTVDAGSLSQSTNFLASAIDSSGNFYQAGYFGALTPTVGGNTDFIMVKYNKSGTILWKRIITGVAAAPRFEQLNGIAVDSDGRIYISGYQKTGAFDMPNTAVVAGYDSNGTYLWSKSFSSYTTINVGFYGICISGAYVIVVGNSNNLGAIWKLDSAGNVLQTISLYSNYIFDGGTTKLYKPTIDINGNLYVVGNTLWGDPFQGQTQINNLLLVKLNSTTGAVIWSRRLSGQIDAYTPRASRGKSVTTDSLGNVFVVGTVQQPGFFGFSAYVAKFDTNGTLLWQRGFFNNFFDEDFSDAVCDSSNNVYVYGKSSYLVGNSLLVKYDPNGNVIWQRSFNGSNPLAISISPDSTNLYLTNSQQLSYYGPMFFGIASAWPTDGSLTGTYNDGTTSWVYAVSTSLQNATVLTNNVGPIISGVLLPFVEGFDLSPVSVSTLQTLTPT